MGAAQRPNSSSRLAFATRAAVGLIGGSSASRVPVWMDMCLSSGIERVRKDLGESVQEAWIGVEIFENEDPHSDGESGDEQKAKDRERGTPGVRQVRASLGLLSMESPLVRAGVI